MSLKIYTLKLSANKWYVGKSVDVMKRFQLHLEGKGSEWTKLYKPISIENIFEGDNFDEDKQTKKLMQIYGIDNVRGGSYVTFDLTADQRRLLEKEINMSMDNCLLCNRPGHFYKDCTIKQLVCEKCGRNGHVVDNCRVKKHIKVEEVKVEEVKVEEVKVEEPKKPVPKRWTQEEEENLLSELTNKITFDKIAELHNRSEYAVKLRACSLAAKMVKSGKNIDELVETMNIDRDILEAEIKKLNDQPIQNVQPIHQPIHQPTQQPINCERCGRYNHNVDKCYAKTDPQDGIELYPIGEEKTCTRCGKTLYKLISCDCPGIGPKGIMNIVSAVADHARKNADANKKMITVV